MAFEDETIKLYAAAANDNDDDDLDAIDEEDE